MNFAGKWLNVIHERMYWNRLMRSHVTYFIHVIHDRNVMYCDIKCNINRNLLKASKKIYECQIDQMSNLILYTPK